MNEKLPADVKETASRLRVFWLCCFNAHRVAWVERRPRKGRLGRISYETRYMLTQKEADVQH